MLESNGSLQNVLGDIHTFIESVEHAEKEFKEAYNQVLKEIESTKAKPELKYPFLKRLITNLESAILEKDFRKLKLLLQQILNEVKDTFRRHSQLDKRLLTPIRNISVMDSLVDSKGIQQSLQLSEKELTELLRNSKSYSNKQGYKQLNDKALYIERVYKEITEREKNVAEKENECISLILRIVKYREEEIERIGKKMEIKELEVKNREIAVETRKICIMS